MRQRLCVKSITGPKHLASGIFCRTQSKCLFD